MRRDSETDSWKQKDLARRKYNERQIDKFIKWSVDQRGFLKYKDLIEQHNKHNIKVYG